MSSSPKKLQADVTIDLCEPSTPGTPQDSEDDIISIITDLDESPAKETPGEDATLPPWGDYKAIQKRRRALKKLQNRGRKEYDTLEDMYKDIRKLTKKFNKLKKLDKMLRKLGQCHDVVDLETMGKDLRELKRKYNIMNTADKLKMAINRYNVVLIAYAPGVELGPDSTCGMTWLNNNTTG